MPWNLDNAPEIREEEHFGGRRVKCFSNRPMSIDRMLRDAVGRNADGEAIVSGSDRMSYAEFDAAVDRVAASLAHLGVEAGDRVALVLRNSTEFLVTLMASARIAAIAVPVNVREQTPELKYILNHCGAGVLVHDGEVADRLPHAADVASITHRFCIDGPVPGSASFDVLLEDPGSTCSAT